ncbi:MAG: phosphoribosylformylglycinamidine synthase subunit PurQ, partial [Cyclobacteriaceae bacterium]|nr:phosphoribosylformylglycinamidine synthase subunit PurQ [Cyclobacteriaceae bacterium]
KSGIIIQTNATEKVEAILTETGVSYKNIGQTNKNRTLKITHKTSTLDIDINELRDTWYRTSYLLDNKQCENDLAKERFNNYKSQPLAFNFPTSFTGKFQHYDINPKRKEKSGIKAAIIREKGVNGDREMAYAMHLAGFDVKDVHMTDLISGREDLSEVNFIVFVGGFSNSDVLGSAKGWAGAFLYNEKAKNALDNFYARKDTLSLGVCNGCQLMMELGLLYPELGNNHPKLHHNDSKKFESSFLTVDIPENNTVMLNSLSGSKLGIWVAHGEGKFVLPNEENNYNITSKYSHSSYPANPNGSDYNVAALASKDGRHLAMMPHLERSIFPWNWPHYKSDRKSDEVSPWVEAFTNALDWVRENKTHS